MNIGISILAGLVIFPAVFALGYSPEQGPGLVFIMIPAVFEQLPLGFIFNHLLYFTIICNSNFFYRNVRDCCFDSDGQKLQQTKKIFMALRTRIFIIGIPSALSFGVLSKVTIIGKCIFDFADYITSSVMLLGAILISIFAGYKISKEDSTIELQQALGYLPLGELLYAILHQLRLLLYLSKEV